MTRTLCTRVFKIALRVRVYIKEIYTSIWYIFIILYTKGYLAKISKLKYILIYGIYFPYPYQNIYHMLVYILVVTQFMLGAAGDFSIIHLSIILKSSLKTLSKSTIHAAFFKIFARLVRAYHLQATLLQCHMTVNSVHWNENLDNVCVLHV